MKNIQFQWYDGDITHAIPRGTINLEQFIKKHQQPTQEILKVFDQIEQAALDGDKAQKAQLKANHLYYFTPGAIFNGRRRYSNIERFTGLAQIDIDNLETEEAKDLKEYLFDNYKEIYCTYLSPSRKGVKALIRIPVVKSIDEFKEYYKGVENEFDWIAGFDTAPKNLALPLFISWDTDILYREDATVWTRKGILQAENLSNLNSKPPANQTIVEGDAQTFKSNAYYRRITLDIFEKKINAITDNGHVQLRSACLVLGSRVGAGYLSQSDAEQFSEYAIKNSQYLQKGISGYITTSRWGIKNGINNVKYYS
jgi:hypothetical protein